MALPIISHAELGALGALGGFHSGYLGRFELATLIHLIASVSPRVMYEFGCNDGRTASRVLEHVRSIVRYIGIDAPRGHKTTLRCQQTEVPLVAGFHALHDPRFELLQQDSATLSEIDPCDAVFVDGDHSHEGVIHDSEIAGKALRPGGVIVWHDYRNPSVEVTAALDWLHVNGWPISHVEGTWLAVLRN